MVEPKYMLDSNILIYLLKGISSAARVRVESCEPGEVVASTIACAEVMAKVPADDADKQADVQRLFAAVKLLPFDARAAVSYRDVPFRRGSFDRLIAAHALSLGVVVVTNNVSDYSDVPGLLIENWTGA